MRSLSAVTAFFVGGGLRTHALALAVPGSLAAV